MAAAPPRILIASTTEGLKYARALKKLLAPEIEASVWDEGLFGPGEFTLESLERHSGDFDGALVLATADDRVIARHHEYLAPRDNVVFEFGLFVAVFGRRRALLLVESTKKMKVPTDVAGLTYVPFPSSTRPGSGLRATAVRVKELAPRWQDDRLDADTREKVRRLLDLAIGEVQDASAITADFGLHLYVPDLRSRPPELVRAARARMGPMSPKTRVFKAGQGVVGTCWRSGEPIFADFTQGPLADATKAEWAQLDATSRFGMSWTLLEESRRRYKAVGAIPVTGYRPDSGFVGCVAFNLGVSSEANVSELKKPRVNRVLNNCAATMAIMLGR